MKSILRKAIWPAVLVTGMLILLGAIGTARTPTALGAGLDGDLCSDLDGFVIGAPGSDNVLGIQGPFPNYDGFGDKQDHKLLLVGHTYLFVIVVEDFYLVDGQMDVSIDDEEGDADIESYADGDDGLVQGSLVLSNLRFVNLPGSGVDDVDQIDNWELVQWDDSAAFIDDLNEDWDVAADLVLSRDYYDFDIADLVDCDPDENEEDGFSFITVTCDEAGKFEISAWEDGDSANVVTNDYLCLNAPTAVSLTATPTTVESVPAVGNISHSLLVLTATDAGGDFVPPGYRVDWTVAGRCIIQPLDEFRYYDASGYWSDYKVSNPTTGAYVEVDFRHHDGLTASATSLTFNYDSSSAPGYQAKSYAAAILHCEGATPGVASVRAELDRSPLSDLVATADVTVVGPPAFITMTAAPSKLVCGEKATILVTVTDAINQKVSDHTVVELITNFGGVIGGTGATLAFPGVNPVTPLSSGAAETFGGVATAYLLTSSTHVGPYEVVASAGGSHLGGYALADESIQHFESNGIYARNGVFSTPVVTSQVTVTCTAGPPAVTAPNTGTGAITPPNTGDAGLAVLPGKDNATQYVIFAALTTVLAGLLSLRHARR